jgi:integrase
MAKVRKRTWSSGGESRSAWVADYTDHAGKRHIKTFPTRKAADAWLVTARGDVARGIHTPDALSATVAEAAGLWLQHGEAERLEKSTMLEFERCARYIGEAMGTTKLSRLTTPMMESYRDTLLRQHSRATAKKILTALKAILKEAQRQGLIAYNPASPVRIDTKRRESSKLKVGVDIPSKDDVRRILEGSGRRAARAARHGRLLRDGLVRASRADLGRG